jgi:acetylornithine deacetylase/succinyl-diaminopimelate desuccinylase-like protein
MLKNALSSLLLAALAGPAPIRFTTGEAYSAGAVAAYRGSHDKAYAHIDANLARHLESIQRWVRQPSVSAQNRGIAEMAAMLRDDLQKLGFKEAELVPTTGHPGVWAYYDAGAPRTLVLYLMYDVQPEETGWTVDPYEGALVDRDFGRVLMARGAVNQKGPERAFLNAVESIIATAGTLPVNIMVAAEGEEELGSPHYPEIIARYEHRLRTAQGVLFPMSGQDRNGAAGMAMGVKGIVSFELEAKGAARGGPQRAEVHSSLKAVVDAPAWRLVQALSTLVSEDGNTILVPGYYDDIRQPTLEEQKLVNAALPDLPAREEAMKKSLAVTRFVDGLSGRDMLSRLFFSTTININGIWSGYTGPGGKTILPHVATARLDTRLVPDQQPQKQMDLIRKHLDARGFADVTLRQISGYPPAQTSVEAPLVQAAISVYNKHGATPIVSPRNAGSAPYYVFTDRLKLPMIPAGLGHGGGAHAPDEYLVIEPRAGSRIASLAQMEKFYVDLLYALAASRG